MQDLYYYGMRNRGFSIGCQPMKGILWSEEDKSGRYHDVLVYSRKLTDAEVRDFELDFIKGPNEMTVSVDTSSLSLEDITIPSSEIPYLPPRLHRTPHKALERFRGNSPRANRQNAQNRAYGSQNGINKKIAIPHSRFAKLGPWSPLDTGVVFIPNFKRAIPCQ